jgi:sucrose-6-phosphate hydrolase SacC (GH32 family)
MADQLYKEAHRPQFHFTAAKNWINDPNSLVYYDGTYHLFFQHNPSGVEPDWYNRVWGHAVSTDLVHWKQQNHAIFPDEFGTPWSGSALV